ncbi:FAD:protein FMN transferase [uncultured Mailhella sp.]|uniref:FAD:protein FMN transferase n=1 Tax=uncultured Mailhella sp. TaxID=1981031 RepID=UPI0025FE19B2|nr:FAD:protein FMN transferase [uncultured Mailhella sp.]
MLTRRFLLKAMAAAATMSALPRPALALTSPDPFVETRLMMGTFVTITVSGVSDTHAADATGRAFARMVGLEDMLTRFDSASPLGQLNSAGVLRDAPQELLLVADAASRMHRITEGAFDPTILALLDIMEQRAGAPLDDKEEAELAGLIGMEHVRREGSTLRFMRGGMKMSLDGIAKGYIADEGARALRASGVKDFLINAGGDIVAQGSKAGRPWRVAVENPEKYQGRTEYPAVRSLYNEAMATSGSYENILDAEGKTNHILNPATGRCSTLPGASVVASSAMEADALATALCVLSQPVAFMENLKDASCLITLPGGRVLQSRRWA